MAKMNMQDVLASGLVVFMALAVNAQDAANSQNDSEIVAQDQEVVILKASKADPAKAVTQPTTVVEGSPLVKSRAEQLRNVRQGAEVETEQKIVEKLEESRLQDEQKRLQTLFGKKQDSEQHAEHVQEQKPAVVIQQQQPDTEKLKSEISESVKADLKKIADEEAAKEGFQTTYSFGGNVGFISYDALNVTSDYAAGFSFGYEFRERMELEIGFLYSEHVISETFYNYQKFDQYNISAGLRYGILPYFIRPVVGAVISYSNREYYSPYNGNRRNADSNAFDMGLIIGVDAEISKNLSLTVDYRHFVNVQNSYENDILNMNQNISRVEDSNYNLTNIGLRLKF